MKLGFLKSEHKVKIKRGQECRLRNPLDLEAAIGSRKNDLFFPPV